MAQDRQRGSRRAPGDGDRAGPVPRRRPGRLGARAVGVRAGAQRPAGPERPAIDEPLVAGAVFVVIELEVQVRDRVLSLSTLTLQTADGHSYSQLTDAGLGSLYSANVRTPGR